MNCLRPTPACSHRLRTWWPGFRGNCGFILCGLLEVCWCLLFAGFALGVDDLLDWRVLAVREELVEVLLAAEGDSDVAQGAEGDLPCLLEALVGGERHYQNEVSILIGCSLVFPLKIETSF